MMILRWLLAAGVVLLAGGLFWWIAPRPKTRAVLVTPDALAYPVLLVNEERIAEVCLSPEELALRPENTDHIIEQRFSVVDAGGRRYRIENFRTTEKRPSALRRLADATVFDNRSFRVAFDLRPDRVLTRDQVLAQLRDRDWELPAETPAPLPLAELFIAYRADRWREFGNARDRMPDERPPGGNGSPSRP